MIEQNQRLSSMFMNDQSLPEKEIMADTQIDLNITKEIKEECHGGVNKSETNYPLQLHPCTEDHITHQASMEETSCQNIMAKLEGHMVQEEDCYFNMGDISGFMWIDHWTPTFQ
jgi:hypothetical protein